MPFIRRRPLGEDYDLDSEIVAPEPGYTPEGRNLQDQLDTLSADTNVRPPRFDQSGFWGTVGRGAGAVYENLNRPLLARPLDALRDYAFESAEQPDQSEALRYLKRYGGAVAETVKPFTSPLGVLSFATGPVGTVARGVLGAEQIAGGVPEVVAGAREGDWKRAGVGALETGMGALLAAEPVRIAAKMPALARERADWEKSIFASSLRREMNKAIDPRRALTAGEALQTTRAAPEAPPFQPPFQEADILNPQLPPAEPGPRFYAGRAGVSEGPPRTTPEGLANEAAWVRPRGELPQRAGPVAAGLPPQPPMTPAEYLRQAQLRQGDPLAELELALRAENVDIPGPRQGPMPEFRPEWPTREVRRGAQPAVQQPEILGQRQPEAVQAPKVESLQELANALSRADVAEAAPARPIAPDVLPERVPTVEPGVESVGRLGRGTVPGRASSERVGPAEVAPTDLDAVEQLIAEARQGGFAGDEAGLRSDLSDRLALMEEMDEAFKASGKDPQDLLRAVAQRGGLKWTPDLAGEFQWLREGQDPTGRGLPRGSVGGVRGVLKEQGASGFEQAQPLDDVLSSLRQEPRFQHLETNADLLEELMAAAQSEGIGSPFAKPTLVAADRLRQNLGRGNWWQTLQGDTSFDPIALERELATRAEPPKVDVLDTGELQARLPGDLGTVREMNVKTPEVAEAPFALAPQGDQGVRELEQTLFAPATPEQAARNAVARAEAERQGPAFLDPAAVEAGRQLERRVQRGVSPTGVERRAAPTPEELGGSASQTLRTGGGLPGAMTPTEFMPTELPVSLPGNVKSYLIRQLGYTPDQVSAMTAEDAIQIGRDRVKNPNPVERVVPVEPPIAPLPGERAELPDIEARDQAILERMKQRPVNLVRKGPIAPPHGAEPGPMPRTAAERQTVGEKLTVKERESLNLPPEDVPQKPRPSLREQGVSPRQIAERVQKHDAWMADPTSDNLGRWVDSETKKVGRYNDKVQNAGTGEGNKPIPRSPSGEVTYSGFDPNMLRDPRLQQHLRDFFLKDDFGNLWARRAVGAGVGAYLNPDNRFKGALTGFLAATYGPTIARGIAADVVKTLKTGNVSWVKKEFGALPKVYESRTPLQDIGLIERYFGGKAHTIPKEFTATRPGVEKWMAAKATGKVSLPADEFRARLGEPVRDPVTGKSRVTLPEQSTFLKPEIAYLRDRAKLASKIGNGQTASYLSQYADELSGTMTRSERLMRDAGIPLKTVNRISTEVSNQIYRVGLAFNTSSAAVNRLSQPLLAVPYTGFKNLWKAYAPLSEAEKGLSAITRPIDISDIGRPALHALDKFDEAASWMMRTTDNQNRQGVYAAAFKTARSTGASPGQAHIFGQQVSEKTQGLLGLLSGNPSWRGPVLKMVKPFSKFPTLVVEWANDIALTTDPRVRWRSLALMGAAMTFSATTGIDLWDILASGPRYGGSNLIRGAMDLYAHAKQQAKDHVFFAAPGKGFLDTDVAQQLYPIGVKKAVELGKRFAQKGMEPHVVRTPSGVPELVTPAEDVFSTMLGIKSTRQTARRELATQAYERTARQSTERLQASAQAKRDYYRALDAGDEAARQEALQRMSPSLRRSLLKMQNLDRLDRIIKAAPKKERPALRDQYGELERELELR